MYGKASASPGLAVRALLSGECTAAANCSRVLCAATSKPVSGMRSFLSVLHHVVCRHRPSMCCSENLCCELPSQKHNAVIRDLIPPADVMPVQIHLIGCDHLRLQLLGELLLDRANGKVMLRYVSDPMNLKLMMILLKDQSRSIQFEAFHVFKVIMLHVPGTAKACMPAQPFTCTCCTMPVPAYKPYEPLVPCGACSVSCWTMAQQHCVCPVLFKGFERPGTWTCK